MSTHKKLTEEVIVRIIKEEYAARKIELKEKFDLFYSVDGEKHLAVSSGLKITKSSDDNKIGKKGQLYTVDQIGTWGAILVFVDEDGEHTIKVDKETLEREFTL
jgi:hypothetical protein